MRRVSLIFLACAVSFTGLVLLLFTNGQENQRPRSDETLQSKPVYEVLKRIRDVTPDNIVQPPKIETELVERLPAVVPPPPPPRPPEPDTWTRPVVLSAGVIKTGDKVIRLADIVPLELDHLCDGADNEQWPCGMLARTEMRMFVRGRAIECDPVEEDSSDRITTRCRLASFDMSAWLVQNGWARPIGNQFNDELKEAKRNNRGIWRNALP